MKDHNPLFYHILALITIIIWGVTFVSTKVLINSGLTPEEIFFYRFLLAYICILPLSFKKHWANNIKDELLLLLCGLTGGSIYFLTENTALGITMASNVSLLICTAPIFTALLSKLFYKEPVSKYFLVGSSIALVGIFVVLFNGNVILKISPIGDILTLLAACSWAFYCILLKRLNKTYNTLFITKKVFFYGVVTVSLCFIFKPIHFEPTLIFQHKVLFNLLFLSIVASLVCFISWNYVVKMIGTTTSTNYLYFTPLVTMIASSIFLDEHITIISIIGALAIIGGVYLAQKRNKKTLIYLPKK